MNMKKEIAELTRMTVTQLRTKHIDVFGEGTRSSHKAYLVKRIAWRMQANLEGDLTARAKRRAEELANDSDLRTHAPSIKADDGSLRGMKTSAVHFEHDDRVPMPGAMITRNYKGCDVVVRVLPKGFEYEGEIFRSLSAVAKVVTGTHWNGYHFFKLTKNGECP